VRVRARAQKTTAQGIVDALKPDILKFHDMSKGNIESIGLLFSESECADLSSTRTRGSFLSVLVYYALRACSFCQLGRTARRRQRLLLKRWPVAEHLGKMVSRRASHALGPLCDLTSACVFVCVCVYADACARFGTTAERAQWQGNRCHRRSSAKSWGWTKRLSKLPSKRASRLLPRRNSSSTRCLSCVCVYARARWTVCVCVRARDGDSEFSRHEHSADTQRVCVGCQACDKIWSHVVENIDSLWAHA
jgi:hypothetical protein